MDDFRRLPVVTPTPTTIAPQPIVEPPVGPGSKPNKKKRAFWIIGAVVGLIISVLASIWVWYAVQLSPVDSQDTNKVVVSIKSGTTPSGIADTLQEEGLIRSASAFLWYTRAQGVQNNLQAGSYRLSPSESTQQIVSHLTKGTVDTFDITFLPGNTLAQNKAVFIAAGYSQDEVDTALNATYDSPLFVGKPANADLEGYIYGETYSFGTTTSVQEVLEHVFEYYYGVIEDNDLIAQYKAQGFSLYEGITLASIIQKEAGSTPNDMAQISQVFHSRLQINMALGSDPTYQYAADKLGVARDTNLDSPYNTRRYAGLPPGPIASPGVKALVATAKPASGDYLFFLSGDDDVTYFARTLQEHEANISTHCQKKCQII